MRHEPSVLITLPQELVSFKGKKTNTRMLFYPLKAPSIANPSSDFGCLVPRQSITHSKHFFTLYSPRARQCLFEKTISNMQCKQKRSKLTCLCMYLLLLQFLVIKMVAPQYKSIQTLNI